MVLVVEVVALVVAVVVVVVFIYKAYFCAVPSIESQALK